MTAWFHRDPDGETYRRVEQRLEFPMVILSLLFIPVILGPLGGNLSRARRRGRLYAGGRAARRHPASANSS